MCFETKNFIFHKIIIFPTFKKNFEILKKNDVFSTSPDESGKPFEVEMHFFLKKNSDQRKLVFCFGKNQFYEKA